MTRAIVFAYHNVGVRCLATLLAHGIEVVRVITHRDNPTEAIWFESVEELAKRYDIPVVTPDDPNVQELVSELALLEPDFLFSFYYRFMLKPPLLAIPRCGAFNMHGSLLPKFRGRAPVNWAVIHGESETGATLHQMVEKPDAGGIVGQQTVPIFPDDTAFDVFNKVTVAAELTLDKALPDMITGKIHAQPQDLTSGSYFGGRTAADGRIDWRASALSVHNLIRGVAPPYPGAYFDTSLGRFRCLRSLLPSGAVGAFSRPTLFAVKDQLFIECSDGKMLRVLNLELNGHPFAADMIPSAFINTGIQLS